MTPARGVFAVLLAAVCLIAAAPASAAAPNVLFIVTDDQALATMQISGALDPMPKTKEWFHTGGTSQHGAFEGGTFFRQGVASTPLCCPARASILSGRYAHNHGVKTNVNSAGPPLTHQPTGRSAFDPSTSLAGYLRGAGYYTGIFGKYLTSWDLNQPPDHPYDHWNEYAIYENPGVQPGYEVNDQGIRKFEFRYETDYVADRAVDFLQRAHTERDEVPWFLYLAPFAPHSPFSPHPKHANAPVPDLDQDDPAYMEADRSDKPPWTRTTLLESSQPENGWPDHLRMLKSVDEMVDRVMTQLQAQGREDRDTIAFFVSDNGFLWGEHGLLGKNVPYAESINIPYLLRWPNGPVAQDHTSDRLVADIDMAPTVVDAVNDAFGSEVIAPNPAAPMDGISLVDPAQPHRSAILTEGWGTGATTGTRGYCLGREVSWASLKTPRAHYIEHYETRPIPPPGTTTTPPGCSAREFETHYENPPIFKEYYDTRPGRDPEELVNLLADDNVSPVGGEAQLPRLVDDGAPENDPPITSLHSRLAQLRACQGQNCRPESTPPADLPLEVAITAKPSDPNGARDVTFSFTANEPEAKFRCSLDARPSRACTSPVTYTGLRGGRHRLRVAGSANGVTRTKLHTWVVDRELPDAAIDAKPRKSSTSDAATFEWTGSEAATSFTCELDGETPVPCTSPHTLEGLTDGEHTFTLAAQGPDGEDPTPAAFTWQVDTRAPDTGITRSPTFSTNSTGATFSLTRTFADADAGTGETADPEFPGRFECRLDGGAWRSCEPSATFVQLPAGARTLEVRATDVAGNADLSPALDQWTIGPIQSFSNLPDTRWPDISAGIEVNDIIPDGAGGFYAAGDFTEVQDAAGQHPHTDLVHITSARTVDNAWNASTDGVVRSIALSPDRSTLYAGGDFSAVGSSALVQDTSRANLAAFSAGTGAPTDWDPDASQEVTRVAMPPTTPVGPPTSLYVAGSFQRLKAASPQPLTRRKVAEIPLTGDGTPTEWNPNVNNNATLLALLVNERYVLVGGSLASVGGSPSPHPLVARQNLAAIDRFDGKAASWAPNPDDIVTTLHSTVRDDEVDTVLAGGSFQNIGNPPAARTHAAQISLADDGTVSGWDPSPGESGVPRAFMTFGCNIAIGTVPEPSCATLAGGTFHTVRESPTTFVARNRLAQVTRHTGLAHDWSPDLDAAASAFACVPPTVLAGQRCDNSATRVLAVGGRFTHVSGVPRGRLAFFGPP